MSYPARGRVPAILLAAALLGGAAPPRSSVPAPEGFATFEDLLATARIVDVTDFARRVLRADADAPAPGTLVAIDTDRVTAVTGATKEEVVVRVPGAIFIPAYDDRLDPANPASPIGPVVTAGPPGRIDGPDFEKSMTYVLPEVAAAVDLHLSFDTADLAAAFRNGAGKRLRAQIVFALDGPWVADVLDTITLRTKIDEHGKTKTEKGKDPRVLEVWGISLVAVGYRFYDGMCAAGPKRGKVAYALPATREPIAAPLVIAPWEEVAAPLPALAEAPVEAAEPSRPVPLGAAGDPLSADPALGGRPTPEALGETVRAEAKKLSALFERCLAPGAPVRADLLFGPTGEVISAYVPPPHKGTPAGRCIASAARRLKVAPFPGKDPISVTHTFSAPPSGARDR